MTEQQILDKVFEQRTPQQCFLDYVMHWPRLGKRQTEVLKMLLNDHHISVFVDLDNNLTEECISDDDKSNTYDLPGKNMIGALLKRGLIEGKRVYSTVQPNTEHLEFRIRPEALEWVRKACI